MEEINNIDIGTISYLIQPLLYKKLIAFKIDTIEKIRNTSINEFSLYKSIGVKATAQFTELKYRIESQPEMFIQKNYTISEEIKRIKLKYLKKIIPNRLYNKLEIIKCEDLAGLFSINNTKFIGINNVGDMILADFNAFKELIVNSPQLILQTYNKEKEVDIPSTIEKDFFIDLSKLVNEYFFLVNDNKAQNIIERRFALKNKNSYTLEEIGLFYGISRERIRQIQDTHIVRIMKLLDGETIKKPYCQCNIWLVRMFKEMKDIFKTYKILSKNHVEDILKARGISQPPSVSIQNFFLAILNGDQYQYDGTQYYIFNDSYRNIQIHHAINIMYTYLLENCSPVSMFDLVVFMKKKDKRFDKVFLESIIEILPHFEYIKNEDSTYIQVTYKYLRTLKDFAYRILYEKNEPMHFTEIWREIQHRSALYKKELTNVKTTLKNVLVSEPNFTSIGRTGKWALKDWQIKTSTIIGLVIECIKLKNAPCKMTDLYVYIDKARPNFRKQSLFSIIQQNSKLVTKLQDGTYILTEWKQHYKNDDITTMSSFVTSSILECALSKIHNQYPNNTYTTHELVTELRKHNVNISEKNASVRFRKCPVLETELVKGKLKITIKEIKTTKQIHTKGKLDFLKNEAITLIAKSENQTMKLSDIVTCLTKDGELKPNVYSIISKNRDTFEKKEINGVIHISLLQNTNQLRYLPSNSIDHLTLIKRGENKTVEFKSSLCWDIIERRKNKELEFMVIKAITSFLNSAGGILYIGINDNGELLGLDNDFSVLKKKNSDGFILYLNYLLIKFYSKSIFAFIDSNVVKINNKDIAVISVRKSDKPVFIFYEEEKLFLIRGAASVQKLDLEETSNYIQSNWGTNT